MIQFIVDKEGDISDVKAMNFKDSKTAAACIALIKNGPKWLPASKNGKKASAYRKQPITFVIEQ
jgi:protein TonB